jgi:hypothetical protein
VSGEATFDSDSGLHIEIITNAKERTISVYVSNIKVIGDRTQESECRERKSLITWAPLPKVDPKSSWKPIKTKTLRFRNPSLDSLVLDSTQHSSWQTQWKYSARFKAIQECVGSQTDQ